jgi:hypothetical protein
MPKAPGKPRVAFDNARFEGDEALTGNAPNREKPRENRHLMCEEIAESPGVDQTRQIKERLRGEVEVAG